MAVKGWQVEYQGLHILVQRLHISVTRTRKPATALLGQGSDCPGLIEEAFSYNGPHSCVEQVLIGQRPLDSQRAGQRAQRVKTGNAASRHWFHST